MIVVSKGKILSGQPVKTGLIFTYHNAGFLTRNSPATAGRQPPATTPADNRQAAP